MDDPICICCGKIADIWHDIDGDIWCVDCSEELEYEDCQFMKHNASDMYCE